MCESRTGRSTLDPESCRWRSFCHVGGLRWNWRALWSRQMCACDRLCVVSLDLRSELYDLVRLEVTSTSANCPSCSIPFQTVSSAMTNAFRRASPVLNLKIYSTLNLGVASMCLVLLVVSNKRICGMWCRIGRAFTYSPS